MATNDNVKIIIQEFDETTPKGQGTSSDIAYVPGLGYLYEKEENAEKELVDKKYNANYINNLSEAAKAEYELQSDGTYFKKLTCNRPVLCTTLSEFEKYFGKYPYVMTASDVESSKEHNYNVGDYDKSYIYAKELINAGLGVIYEAVVRPVDNILTPLVEVDSLEASATPTSNSRFQLLAPERGGESSSLTETYKFMFVCPDEGSPLDNLATFAVRLENEGGPHIKELKVSRTSIDGSANITGSNLVVKDYSASATFTVPEDEVTRRYTNITATLTLDWTDITDSAVLATVIVVAGKNGIEAGKSVSANSAIDYLYDSTEDRLTLITDKNEYSIKYITSGGYPTFMPGGANSECSLLLNCAEKRQDAVALIDPADNFYDTLALNSGSTYDAANSFFASVKNGSYGAMFIPWGTYTCVTVPDKERTAQLMPPSFGYLMCLATAIKTSPNWLAMAGVTRGIVPNLKSLHVNKILSNVVAENYQPKFGDQDSNKISINAITKINPYGLTLWGNRTLEPVDPKGTVALNFLNTRNMVSDIKKLAYSTAKSLMFEQDSDALWLKFKSGISPLLDQLKSGFGISDYKIIKGTTKYNGQALTRGEMAAVIKVFPLYAIEYFEISVVIADNDVSVE